MRKDGGNQNLWSFGDALRYHPFGNEGSFVTPKQLLKWSFDGHCTIRANFHLSSQGQGDSVVGSRPNQSNHLSDDAVKDFFLAKIGSFLTVAFVCTNAREPNIQYEHSDTERASSVKRAIRGFLNGHEPLPSVEPRL
jgi:hypothetical protein